MNEEQIEKAEFFIKQTLRNVGSYLDAQTIEAVEHYLENAEYEMAFEGLYIEIMANPSLCAMTHLNKSKDVGLLLKLDKHTAFDPNFWSNFMKYH
jgi:hypothetical protein